MASSAVVVSVATTAEKEPQRSAKGAHLCATCYQSLKENYLGEAAALMAASQEAEQLKETDAVIEREIAARRALRKTPPPRDYVCAHCGFENPVPVKFCGECGTRMTDHPRKP